MFRIRMLENFLVNSILKSRISLASFKSSSVTSACMICRRLTTEGASDTNNGLNNNNTKKIFNGIVNGERAALARGITLVESTNKQNGIQSRILVNKIIAHCKQKAVQEGKHSLAFRIGLSGPPGAGKSTFTEIFGKKLTAGGHKVAVLAVDPSSGSTGGSILGDKTRMPELTRDMSAFIRPSPSRGHLGGVTRTTNEAIVLCEAAGYDIVLVETVGVGQSEYLVRDMVDMFCLLLPPAGGDELQGIKRGIVEQSDLIVVTKYDGDLMPAARRVAHEYMSALKYLRPTSKHWRSKVQLCSAVSGEGIQEVWSTMQKFKTVMEESGELESRRKDQHLRWMWGYVEERLIRLAKEAGVSDDNVSRLEMSVKDGDLSPGAAADSVIQMMIRKIQSESSS